MQEEGFILNRASRIPHREARIAHPASRIPYRLARCGVVKEPMSDPIGVIP
jgi:hypothetical protein